MQHRNGILMEAAMVAEDKRVKESCREVTPSSGNTTAVNNTDNKESIQQSVIMRRTSNDTVSTVTDITNQSQETPLSKLSSLAEGAELRHKSVDNPSRLYGACTYDVYKQSFSYHQSGLQGGRTYPVMPQPGYTSVIVDAQQYHLANGYAH